MNATPTPSTPLDAPAILSRARVLLFRLRNGPSAGAIDARAAAAVTAGRHGEAGQRFAGGILAAIGADAGEVEIDRAIVKALTGGRR